MRRRCCINDAHLDSACTCKCVTRSCSLALSGLLSECVSQGIGLVVLVMNLFWYCLYVGRALGLIRKAAKPQPPAAEPQKADKIQ